jgi:hypothetical protein
MTANSYGTWDGMFDFGSPATDVRDFIELTLDEHTDDYTVEYDVDAIEKDYRAAVNDALPDGVALVGDEFYGPDDDPDPELLNYEFPNLIGKIDLWAIAQRHIITR